MHDTKISDVPVTSPSREPNAAASAADRRGHSSTSRSPTRRGSARAARSRHSLIQEQSGGAAAPAASDNRHVRAAAGVDQDPGRMALADQRPEARRGASPNTVASATSARLHCPGRDASRPPRRPHRRSKGSTTTSSHRSPGRGRRRTGPPTATRRSTTASRPAPPHGPPTHRVSDRPALPGHGTARPARNGLPPRPGRSRRHRRGSVPTTTHDQPDGAHQACGGRPNRSSTRPCGALDTASSHERLAGERGSTCSRMTA